jgi:cytochrome c oxidase cbb3-type subunit 3
VPWFRRQGCQGLPQPDRQDWLFGGTPDQIKESIAKGRDAAMPAKGVKPDLNGDQIKDLANYVRSLSGLAADSIRASAARNSSAPPAALATVRMAKAWSAWRPICRTRSGCMAVRRLSIVETITKGRINRMPAFGEFLGDAKVHLLTAYVYGLGGGTKEEPLPLPAASLRKCRCAGAPAEKK